MEQRTKVKKWCRLTTLGLGVASFSPRIPFYRQQDSIGMKISVASTPARPEVSELLPFTSTSDLGAKMGAKLN